jgi:2-dehydro-3-deoxygluconokinase
MLEIVTFGETMAVMAPREAGTLRYVTDFKLRIAGAESNTAIGLAKLGHTAGWISALGDDELGEYVLSSVRSEGVDVSGVKIDASHRTGLMIKRLSRGETAVYYYRDNSAASHLSPRDVPEDYLKDAKIIHMTGITPVLSDSCMKTTVAVADYAKKNGILLSFDPNIRRKLWGEKNYSADICKLMFASDIVLGGVDEFSMLLGSSDFNEIVTNLRAHGVKYIAIKDGSRGAWCADEKDLVHVPPEKCNPIDPVGAGDGFNAGFLAGILEGHDLATIGKMGAIAGAMATETQGDVEGYPTKSQMDSRLQNSEQIYR